MKIGLIDVDGHHFPNLALMKLSAWHKAAGDSVEWCNHFERYDRVYKSKVFTFSPDDKTAVNADYIRMAGTGYKDYDTVLQYAIEHITPDYGLYGVDYAVGFTTRGCVNHCPWCVVPKKEGAIRPASPLREFLADRKTAVLLDNNALAHPFGLEQMEESIRLGVKVDYNQGLEAKLVCDNPAIADLLARMKWQRYVRFAADTTERLPYVVKAVEMLSERGLKPYRVFVYVLIRDVQDALHRINALMELRVIPFAQPYRDFDNMTEPTQEQKDLARWCNMRATFKSCTFDEYNRHIKR